MICHCNALYTYIASKSITYFYSGDNTVTQIKQSLWRLLRYEVFVQHLLFSDIRDEGHVTQECDSLWDPEKFTLTYEMNSNVYELYDEQQILYVPNLFKVLHFHVSYYFLSQTTTVAQLWRQEKRQKGQLSVVTKRAESKEEKTLNMAISSMIGIGLYQLQFANNDELDITRRKMVA